MNEWVGFAAFGLGYFALGFWFALTVGKMCYEADLRSGALVRRKEGE